MFLSIFCRTLRSGGPRHRGRAVQVHPIKPTLKAPGARRLKLKYDELLSSFALKFNLRRYTEAMYNLGIAQAEAGEVNRAIIAYESTLRLRPRCAEAWNNMAGV